jgi:hypothetical protein
MVLSLLTTRRLSKPRGFNFEAKRRREIILHARHVGARQTEDFSRWLIAWHWHNPKARDPIWSLTEAARRMGGKITEAQSSAITEEASVTRKHLTADKVAKFLGVTYAQREALRLTTIGSIDVKKRARKELRKRRDRLAKEAKRRAAGIRPQSESLSATQPWRELGMSRRTWYRRNRLRTGTDGTTLSAAIFLKSEDRSVPADGEKRGADAPRSGRRAGPSAPKKASAFRLATATTMAADRYASLPLGLRFAALCLPIPETASVPEKKLRAA